MGVVQVEQPDGDAAGGLEGGTVTVDGLEVDADGVVAGGLVRVHAAGPPQLDPGDVEQSVQPLGPQRL